jgi:hypothetical protein
MSEVTFKRADFDICLGGTDRETVSGHVCGTYGIHKAEGPRVHKAQPYRVYDLNTGLRVEHLINTLKDAKALVRLLWLEVGTVNATGWGREAKTDREQLRAMKAITHDRAGEWRNS